MVKTMDDGTKAVAYMEFTGLFIEAFKEQQQIIERQEVKIDELEIRLDQLDEILSERESGKYNSKKTLKDESENKNTQENVISPFVLYQNTPNPFRESTEIRFILSNQYTSSKILIFNIQGKQIKEYPIKQIGQGSIVVEAGSLKPGKYIYSLIVDNQELYSKSMILTK